MDRPLVARTGRNNLCPCGSGKKYKHCCLGRSTGAADPARAPALPVKEELSRAIAHHQAGQWDVAESLYRRILAADPQHADALHLFGVICRRRGLYQQAVAQIRKAICIHPGEAIYYSNLGNALKDQGHLDAAAASYAKALALDRDYADAYSNLGLVLQEQGDLPEAAGNFRQALLLKPDHAEAHYNLGTVLQLQGAQDDAASRYMLALILRPAYAEAFFSLGTLLHDQEQLPAAFIRYEQALDCRPSYAEALGRLGAALQAQGRFDEAVARYKQALAIKPDLVAALSNLGNALRSQGRLDDAVARFEQALAIKPDCAETFYNRGNALQDLLRRAEAIRSYGLALVLQPDFAEALYNLGHILMDQGELDAAMQHYEEACVRDPDFVDARWALALARIPFVYQADQDPLRCRQEFSAELEALSAWSELRQLVSEFQAVGSIQPFYLAYQEEDNSALLSRYGQLCAAVMGRWQQLHGYRAAQLARTGRIRVGIVSDHIHGHSVWQALIKGWMLHLDTDRFELQVFYLGSKHDAQTDLARAAAADFISGKTSLAAWVEAILVRRIEVLIFPEVGMSPMTAQLASLRLAPVQVASWGHPETTGLPTMDYYLSAEDLEGAGAAAYYKEKLVQLPHLGCCYHTPEVTPVAPDLVQLGIAAAVPLLLCPGTPFKYAPQYDGVLVDIARRLGRCQLVFFNNSRRLELCDKLRQRLVHVFRQAGLDFDQYGVFIPWLDAPQFYGLMQRADVFLDTIGFSGFNTAMQAVECALPIVTREGRFLRGRLASGILKRMQLDELVAADEAGYVDRVLKLLSDGAYRQRIKAHMVSARHVLFDDRAPITALESFLVDVCRTAPNHKQRAPL